MTVILNDSMHGIVQTSSYDYACTKCNRQLTDLFRVQENIASHEHQRRVLYDAFAQDPLAHVPEPHRLFVVVDQGGNARCVLCDRCVDDSHMMSGRHQKRIQDPRSYLYGPHVHQLDP